MDLKKLKSLSLSDLVLLSSIVLIGVFNEFLSCIISLITIGFIFLKLSKSNRIQINKNLLTLSVCLICLFYGISIFWAIDSGMAFIGFIKFLPLFLFLILKSQEDKSYFEEILPYFTSLLILISSLLSLIPLFKSYFLVAGRLAGVFQYPNTFALLILISELVLLSKFKLNWQNILLIIILVGGLLYTGSRAVFILFIISNLIILIYNFRKINKKLLLIIGASAVLVIGLILIFMNFSVLERFSNISLKESTFVGRFLYLKDALPLILKYPFGMGFLGYSYIQHGIQTGVYTVKYIHNDLLQLLLDIGWAPTLFFVFNILKTVFSKDFSFYKKVIVLTLCAHSCFDFNLQFVSMFLILIYFLDNKSNKIFLKKTTKSYFSFSLMVLLIINIYMGTALSLSYFKFNDISEKLYPWNTENKIQILKTETDLTRSNSLADEIIKQNDYSYIPYTIKAKYAYSKGDFGSLIKYKNTVFKLNPFEYKEYEEYCTMLINGISIYKKMNDTASIKVCNQELLTAYNRLNNNKNRLSEFGKLIKDQPITELPEDITHYIKSLE